MHDIYRCMEVYANTLSNWDRYVGGIRAKIKLTMLKNMIIHYYYYITTLLICQTSKFSERSVWRVLMANDSRLLGWLAGVQIARISQFYQELTVRQQEGNNVYCHWLSQLIMGVIFVRMFVKSLQLVGQWLAISSLALYLPIEEITKAISIKKLYSSLGNIMTGKCLTGKNMVGFLENGLIYF